MGDRGSADARRDAELRARPLTTLRRLERGDVPAQLAGRFAARPASLRAVSTGANAIYRCECDGAVAYLRVTHAALRDAALVRAAARYLAHLHAAGAPVSAPLRTAAGEWVAVLEDGSDRWLATAVRSVPGAPLTHRCTEPERYRAWGRALAQLHAAAATYRPPESAAFFSVDAQWHAMQARLPRDDAELCNEAQRVEVWLRGQSREPDRFGLTHGDCNAGNALWDGARVWLIDFDEPMYQGFAADVARPWNEVRDRSPQALRTWSDALIAGYREVRALSDDEVRDLPWHLRLKALDIYLWLRSAWLDDQALGGETRAAQLVEFRARVTQPLRW